MSIANDTLVSDFLALDAEVKAAEAEVKRLKEQRDNLEGLIVEQWGAIGQQSVKINGQLVYRQRELHVSVPSGEREAVVAACEELGLNDLVETTVPTGRLKAWIKEQLGENGEEPLGVFETVEDRIPDGLRGRVKVFESYGLRIRKG